VQGGIPGKRLLGTLSEGKRIEILLECFVNIAITTPFKKLYGNLRAGKAAMAIDSTLAVYLF
jgi:hypothetical protein